MAEYIDKEVFRANLEVDCYGRTDIVKIGKAMDLAKVQTWIPVTERLPEHEDPVLCFIKNGQQEILQLDKFENLWIGMQWKYKRHAVTHWMPLPDVPKEDL